MSGVTRKVTLAGAMLVAAAWMGGMTLAISATSVRAQDLDSQQSADTAADASAVVETPDVLPITVGPNWSGTIDDDTLGLGDFQISFNQPPSRSLKGGWLATFNDGPQYLGNFTGKSTPKTVNFNLQSGTFEKKTCRIKFKSVTANGGFIEGNYKWSDCGKQFKGFTGGSISLSLNPPE
jgi:hypothetical protein